MSFKEITPYIKIVSQITATPRRLRNGDLILWFSFAETLLKSYGKPKRFNIEVDDETNQVRCTVDINGKFLLKELSKGGGRVQLEAFGCVRDGLESDACKLIDRTDQYFIFELPATWSKVKSSIPVRNVNRADPPKDLSTAPQPDGRELNTRIDKLDAIAYLRSKGVKISKLAQDWWQLGNERVPSRRILEEVNKWRLRAELPPLSIDQLQ